VSARKTAPAAGPIRLLLLLLLIAGVPANAFANDESERLRAQASRELYSLDREKAQESFRQAVAADPRDAGAYRGLASSIWLSVTFRRGNMTVDDYMGGVTRRKTPFPPPAPETVTAFNDALNRALSLARERVAANPKDADAHYEVGAAMGLRASYTATVESSALGAFKAAREAYDEHEKVLQLDIRRKDAGLIVGTYRYIVASLSMPLRWAAYMVGFGGGREQGLKLVEGAAGYDGDNQEEARFTLVVLYNREKQYDAALAHLAMLRERYPRNRLAWLESGSTSLRAGRTADAERYLDEGMHLFATDTRPRMFGEDSLWYGKRGTARASLGHSAQARTDLEKALTLEGRDWLHGRAHFELAKLDLKEGRTAPANEHLRAAVRLCENDNDETTAAEARRLIK
jgi:tetratricopeptide (TPR) repeat protein